MPLPLILLGAGLAALYARDKYTDSAIRNSVEVSSYPGEDDLSVLPQDGAIVSCGIFGMFDHTGIWLDGNIIELRGNGLIRAISAQRFLANRSGKKIYILCDEFAQPLIAESALDNATAQLYQYSKYHVIRNNCHRFVWRCVSGQPTAITSFYDLNQALYGYFSTSLKWLLCQIN
ncbi:hypothetical protein [Aliiglaciecola sp. LCG003]|uniref:hypothetical protein n=1 Tax=Aliiglaciecola sp. LCG003 TaxID=3053655 RepID=UPI0025745591|nr:hypothetical protein [Aliiglaciecola sp. LCG003]WJG07675.1 hypothetical protein QR722_09860 [Aliiglaciecola sp. LCG003]